MRQADFTQNFLCESDGLKLARTLLKQAHDAVDEPVAATILWMLAPADLPQRVQPLLSVLAPAEPLPEMTQAGHTEEGLGYLSFTALIRAVISGEKAPRL